MEADMKNVTVHVPGTLNLDQCHKVLASVLGKCGHPNCLSGFNIAFENAVDPADMVLTVEKGSLNVTQVR
jgi:hypothetical protein